MASQLRCPGCGSVLSTPAAEGGLRLKCRVVLVDPSTGAVDVTCPDCRSPVRVCSGGTVAESMRPVAAGRRVLVGVPRTAKDG